MDIVFLAIIFVVFCAVLYFLFKSPQETEEMVERFNQENGIGNIHIPVENHESDPAPWFKPIEIPSKKD